MAELNLVPNVPVIAVQTAIFVTNLIITKKLLVEPYQQLRAKRDQLTTGSQEDAVALTAANEKHVQEIESRIQNAAREAALARESVRKKALDQRAEIVAAAEAAAAETIASVTKEIRADLAAQKVRVPEIVQQLTQDVYKVAIS